MNEDPNAVSAAPAGWYPDPSGEHQLRYWEGAVWTHHVAPLSGVPGAVAPSPAQHHGYPGDPGQHPFTSYAAGGYPIEVNRPPRQKIFTPGTWVVLAATVIIVAGSLTALGWGANSAAEAIEAQAPDVLNGFMTAATTGDPAWEQYASESFASAAGSSTPLYGDAMAAETIDLSIAYSTSELTFGWDGYVSEYTSQQEADLARAQVELTYTFTVDGEAQTATVSQMVWMTRPFYYGDDVPSAAREDGTPTAVGPWRVTGLESTEYYSDDAAPVTTTYTPEFAAEGCISPQQILIAHSNTARTEGYIGAICLSGEDETTVGEGVDYETFVAAFPVLTEAVPLEEVMGIATTYEAPAPLEEYRLEAGDVDYVITFATGGNGPLVEESERRIISIQIAETR